MSTLPITFKSGDSLVKIAEEVLGDSSNWRQLADINNLDIFSVIEVGQSLTVPNKESAERRLKDIAARQITFINENLQTRISEITETREIQTITKLLGVDTSNLLKDLDLSSLADKLTAPTNAERLRQSLNSASSNEPLFRLVSWVL